MKYYRSLIYILLLCFLFTLTGCTKKDAAQTPGELKVCSSLGKEITELLVQDFIKQSKVPLKPSISYVPSGSTEERFSFITQGGYDCWLGGTAEEYYYANEKGLLERYTAQEAFKLPVELRNRRNIWTPLYFRHIALISNKNKLSSFGLYAPTTWDELLHHHLREEIAIPSYNLGGASFGMLTSIWQLRGKEQALKYAAAFNRQLPSFTKSTLEAADLVYTGKKTVAIVPLDYALELEEKHAHLFATIPNDANRNLISGIALLKKAPNQKNATNFIDYLLTDTSEKLLHNKGYKYLWHVKDYPNNNNRKALIGHINIPYDDLAWTSTYKSEIIRQWNEAK